MGLNFDGNSITFSDGTVQTIAFSGISITGSGYIEVTPDGSNYTISSSGLQPNISNPSGITGALAITNIISISQADYDALPTKDSSTLYVIT